MTRSLSCFLLVLSAQLTLWTDLAQASSGDEYEAALVDAVDRQRLARWHESYSEEVHVAGDEGDARLIDTLRLDFETLGLEVEVHRFHAYLPRPVSAKLEIVAEPEELGGGPFSVGASPLPLALPIREKAVEGDRFVSDERTSFGWNAYAASGDVTADVVYANYGLKEDFAELKKLGVDVKGKIVLARYGGNFRGYKAKFAEAAGAVGLVIFTDPADAGFRRGDVWPRGGYANETYIQRGSVLTLDYPGDPLTPFVDATEDAERLDPEEVDLPRIPVQPIGWGAAWEIVRRMTGDGAPNAWQGGLPTYYRLGGKGLRLRLQVEQERRLVETANVVGMLRGTEQSDQWVLIGSHHDAWSFGAGDPNAGSILVTEAAKAFAEAAQRGRKPKRSILFAHWGAEEYGIIGSTEWVEGRRQQLEASAVAYLNLDGAALGTRFGSQASPTLKTMMEEISRVVEHPDGDSIWDHWNRDGEAPFGDLGGGSDHVAFYCHAGVPSAGIAGRGTPGVAYHSNYGNLDWYWKMVGDDYRAAEMLAHYVVRWAARLADYELLPLDPSRYGEDVVMHLDAMWRNRPADEAKERTENLRSAAEGFSAAAREDLEALARAVEEGRLDAAEMRRANEILLGMERLWLTDAGIPDRPWYRNLFAATDADSGYAPWMLPALRWTLENDRLDRWKEMEARYLQVFHLLQQEMSTLAALADRGAS
ncbi:MAG: M28 family peptidase [Thermoanaerobaculia bacterium]|nr:M28 family peptidase [Thermoanaerobaculia bacterium]